MRQSEKPAKFPITDAVRLGNLLYRGGGVSSSPSSLMFRLLTMKHTVSRGSRFSPRSALMAAT
jgi:hypothetical protein